MIDIRNAAVALFSIVLSVNCVHAQDLSNYRGFHFGMSLPDVLKKTQLAPSDAKVIHARPALIQELDWDAPFSIGAGDQTNPPWTTVFSFYNGELSRIVVNYDRNKTEGLTTQDMVEAISAVYGTPTTPASAIATPPSAAYTDSDAALARWENPEYSIALFHDSYPPSYKLTADSKRLDALTQTATTEALRLDNEEAPQREIERQANETAAVQAAQEEARTTNKPRFRP